MHKHVCICVQWNSVNESKNLNGSLCWGKLSAEYYEVFHISYSSMRLFSFGKVLWRGSKNIEFLDGQIPYQTKFPLRLDTVILRTFDTLKREV